MAGIGADLALVGGLTLYTFQTKHDFSGLGPYLFGGLCALIFTGLIGAFFPFSANMELVSRFLTTYDVLC